MTKTEFINKIGSIAQAEYIKRKKSATHWILPSVCIAQACLESNYGQASTMMKYNAPFGIKATKTWKGQAYSAFTKEFVDSTMIGTTACFRAYDSLEEAVHDYYNLICGWSNYSLAWDKTDPTVSVREIARAGYATSPTYYTNVCKVLTANPEIKNYDLETIVPMVEEEPVVTNDEYYPTSDYNKGSIVDALKSIKVDSSLAHRKLIAQANGVEGYKGSAAQNKILLGLFKEGKLRKE